MGTTIARFAVTAIVAICGMAGAELYGQAPSQQEISSLLLSLDTAPEQAHSQAEPLLQQLFAAGRFAEAEQLAIASLRGCTLSPFHLQNYQTLRMKACLAQGKKQEALQNAKVLYNVAKFGRTTEAVKEVAECLKAVHPRGEAAARDFRLYQQWASRLPTDPPTTRPANLPHNPLDAIEVDPSPFAEYYAQVENDFSPFGHARRACLLLLMDRTEEAEEAAYTAWNVSLPQDQLMTAEDYARAIRAHDGGTGRALAFLLSLDHRK